MQKKLIAVAVASLVSGAAFAQSNVTIYGVGDATYDNVSATGAAYNAANLPSRGRTTFNSSYIGFKGAESLGNGLTAVFQFETGIGENPNGSFGSLSGTSNAVTLSGNTYGWANRDTMVAIAGGFGTLAFGNLTGPTRLLGAVMDPNAGSTGIGANTALLAKMGGGAGAGVFDQRIANAIAYISPTFSGFYGVIGYLPNENRGTDAAHQPNISAWTFGGVYGNGPILAGLTYTKAKDQGADSTGGGIAYGNNSLAAVANNVLGLTGTNAVTTVGLTDTSDIRFGFKYDFGMATVGILYDQMKATAAHDYGNAKQTVWYIPVTVKLGNGKLIGQYGKANNISLSGALANNTVANLDTTAKHFMIGYEYNLSKRTMVKALWSQISNGQNASYDFLYGVSQPNSTGYSLAGVPMGADPRGLSIGLRHSF